MYEHLATANLYMKKSNYFKTLLSTRCVCETWMHPQGTKAILYICIRQNEVYLRNTDIPDSNKAQNGYFWNKGHSQDHKVIHLDVI